MFTHLKLVQEILSKNGVRKGRGETGIVAGTRKSRPEQAHTEKRF